MSVEPEDDEDGECPTCAIGFRHNCPYGPDYDPTPWCHYCGAKTQQGCHCPPDTAENQ